MCNFLGIIFEMNKYYVPVILAHIKQTANIWQSAISMEYIFTLIITQYPVLEEHLSHQKHIFHFSFAV